MPPQSTPPLRKNIRCATSASRRARRVKTSLAGNTWPSKAAQQSPRLAGNSAAGFPLLPQHWTLARSRSKATNPAPVPGRRLETAERVAALAAQTDCDATWPPRWRTARLSPAIRKSPAPWRLRRPSESRAHPAVESAFDGDRGRQFRRYQRNGNAPEKRNEQVIEQRQPGPARRDHVFQPERPAGGVRKHHEDERQQGGFAHRPARFVFLAGVGGNVQLASIGA